MQKSSSTNLTSFRYWIAKINSVAISFTNNFHPLTGHVDSPRNAGNHGNIRKFHKSDQTLYQTKRDINKLCLGKISLQKTVRMKLSVVSGFSNMLYGKKRKPGNAGNWQKAF